MVVELFEVFKISDYSIPSAWQEALADLNPSAGIVNSVFDAFVQPGGVFSRRSICDNRKSQTAKL